MEPMVTAVKRHPEEFKIEALVRYLAETSHKASRADDKSRLRWLDGYLNGVALGAIDRELLNRIAEQKKAEGVSNATVDRMLEVIRPIRSSRRRSARGARFTILMLGCPPCR